MTLRMPSLTNIITYGSITCLLCTLFISYYLNAKIGPQIEENIQAGSSHINVAYSPYVVVSTKGVILSSTANVEFPITHTVPFASVLFIEKSTKVGNRVKVLFPFEGFASVRSGGSTLLRPLDISSTRMCIDDKSKVKAKTDLKGGDILTSPFEALNADECCQICSHNKYTYDGMTPNVCWMDIY